MRIIDWSSDVCSSDLIVTPAIICAVRHHGEHGVIARLMTPDNGLMAGYVRGGRSTRLRPVLMPSNLVQAEFRARTGEQLASLTVELEHSRSEEHTSELQSLIRISYAVFCLKKKKKKQ